MNIANPRHGIPGHLINVDQDAYTAEVATARAAMTSAFVVAPRCTVITRRGLARAGTEVAQDDLPDAVSGDGAPIPAWRRFQDLVRSGVVLEKL